MKYPIFFTLFFGLFLKSSPAQTYTPFPDSNAVWNILEMDSYYPDSTKYNTVHYALFGDTIINAISYSKLFYNDGLIDSTIHITSPNTIYLGALREENSIKKIYYLPKDSANEILLYNFEINVGDTFFIPFQQSSWINILKCMGKDSILINNLYRKTYDMWHPLSYTWTRWIEGIGGNKGLLDDFSTFNTSNKLLCFYDNDILTYRLDSSTDIPFQPFNNIFYYHGCYYDTTTIITTNMNELADLKDIVIYPNPLIRSTIISIQESIQLKNVIIDVFDLQGKTIKTLRNLRTHQNILTRNDFRAAGVYFVRIKSDKYLETIKLIVQ